ncbi:Choline/Carnitine O-acyltransferase [Ancylostoma duodenale]|uniref:Choline/Carnitine O-acyltransferase n=1 Tax=Ancylostoma duodenale TaxID=51022 RepID=A0A0C2BZT9_9BILA|nr:Choline/Carnitine O-acyltransferase [Ancylostoma duodenale]
MEYMMLKDIIQVGYDENGNCKGEPTLRLKPERLKWDIPEPALTAMEVSMEVAQNLIDDVEMALLVWTDYGKGFIKKLNVSPDAFLQMCLQYTYYKNQNKFSLTYEASMTRLYREGRTETVRSCTTQSSEFVLAMVDPKKTRTERLQLLRRACDRHQELYRDAMCGKGVDRHLFALYVIKRYLEEESPFFDKIFPPMYLLSTSQTPLNQVDSEMYGMDAEQRLRLTTAGGKFKFSSPYHFFLFYFDTERKVKLVEVFSIILSPTIDQGRFIGLANSVPLPGGFGPVADRGYGVSYIVAGEHQISFHISSKRSADNTV